MISSPTLCSDTNIVERLISSICTYQHNHCFNIADQYFTYEQLGQRVEAIRAQLQSVASPFVGLVANNDLDTYASILALWMQGKAYVPLHPLQPLARCKDIVLQMQIDTILDSSQQTRYEEGHIIMTSTLPPIQFQPQHAPIHPKDQMAYVLFTSGSTGRPKGVCISMDNLNAFVRAEAALHIGLSPEDRCLQMFDLTFDLSVCSYLLPLLSGACAYTVKLGTIKWQEAFRLLEDYQLTVALMVPSVIHYLRPYLEELEAPQMRHSLFAGEGLPADDIVAWQQALPQCQLWNVYGPTENTIYCTAYAIPRHQVAEANGIVGIGKAMEGTHTCIIDEQGQRVPQGEKGELCLASLQLTPGYWHDEEKNKAAFFEADGLRWYHTGDICSENEQGQLLYYGRLDSQVKIQGYRIELSEIEHVATRYYDTKVATVAVALPDRQGNTTLHLAIEDTDSTADEALKAFLQQLLPAYMIPQSFHHLGKFPQNANNKIDRKQIKQIVSGLL